MTRLIVVKLGSSLVVDSRKAEPRTAWLHGLAADIAATRARGTDVIVVSSGAIALARHALGLTQARLRLEEKQAAAAVGQIRLAQAWSTALQAHGLVAAQLLLTLGDTEDRRRYLNARATLQTLLTLGCVPVINENDSVATTEIRFGDNDRLAARVAEMVQADQLILFSDIDGLYTADPKIDATARHIAEVTALTPEIEAMGGDPPAGYSSGGMRTKLLAARIATQAGTAMAIALGHRDHPLGGTRSGTRAAPGSCQHQAGVRPARNGSPACCNRQEVTRWMQVPRVRSQQADRCCRWACVQSPASSRKATRCLCSEPVESGWRKASPPTMLTTPCVSRAAVQMKLKTSWAGEGATS